MRGNREEQWQCNSVSNEYHQSQKNNWAAPELNTILIDKKHTNQRRFQAHAGVGTIWDWPRQRLI